MASIKELGETAMRRSDVINHAYAERLEEELVKAKGMTLNALEKAYAEKAALLSDLAPELRIP
ncbi:hypothetical protein B1806_08050 [Metallibacterium scheffleri]|uniref:Uncharacterized protein n=1 Tax=Metallibacterium scheffleri TaxID=993689 RepID=A0A4S3KNW9_9GAMM|nr:hypothetical protein B1806_08050 [Metallibacterium scheffleri]